MTDFFLSAPVGKRKAATVPALSLFAFLEWVPASKGAPAAPMTTDAVRSGISDGSTLFGPALPLCAAVAKAIRVKRARKRGITVRPYRS